MRAWVASGEQLGLPPGGDPWVGALFPDEGEVIVDFGTVLPLPDGVVPVQGQWRYSPDRNEFYPDPAMLKQQITQAVQSRMDDYAIGQGFDSILSACSYYPSKNAARAAKAQGAVDWRDACWDVAEAIEVAVMAGQRPVPTVDDVLAELPQPTW